MSVSVPPKPDYFLELGPLGLFLFWKDGDLVLADNASICTYLTTTNTLQIPPSLWSLSRLPYSGSKNLPITNSRRCWFTVFRQRVLAGLGGGRADEAAVQATERKSPPLFVAAEKPRSKTKEFIVRRAAGICRRCGAVQVPTWVVASAAMAQSTSAAI